MNPFALGIENGDTGDSGVHPGADPADRWRPLSNQAEDLTGMKVFLVLHPDGAQDAVLIWIAQFPQFRGSGDIEDGNNPATTRRLARHPGWRNMLFTERNYRTLALLCRLLAEQNGLPRNFPLLPYLDNARDATNAALFRKLILSDQRRDLIARKLGTTTAIIEANEAAFTSFYNANSARRIWSRFFGWDPDPDGNPNTNDARVDLPCFRGFLSHDINGGHPCPGPLFDWHRFAREVWDWWWYPFDFVLEMVVVPPRRSPSTTPRPYLQARRDTQLIDYYYDAIGAADDYTQLRVPPNVLSPTERFVLPIGTRVYAMANGVVVAARFALSNNPASSGFLLVRHEVFHHGAANRIDYDLAPAFVWTLIYFLDNAGFSIPAAPPAAAGATSAANPDWLNRFIMRLRECELAVQYHNANAANAALTRGWAHNPSGAGPRLATGQEIEQDATAYRALANDLQLGRPVLFPLEANPVPTPVRVILGDFLGFPNRMAQNQDGIRIEIFSNAELDVPNRTRRACSASTEDWWRAASAAIRHEAVVEMDLPPDGVAWHYQMTDFLEWINSITWASEWEKYGVFAAGGGPVAAPPRPISRRVL